MRKNKGGSAWQIILTAVITAAIVGGGVYWWQNLKIVPEKEVLEITETPDVQKEEEVSVVPSKLVDTAISGTAIEQSYNFRSGDPDGIVSIGTGSLIFLERKALGKIYKNEEWITSSYAPEHPTNPDIVFISTGDWSDATRSINKIYSYNIKTGEIMQLHEEYEGRLLRTMGMDGSKLILMYDGIDNSPGPCFSAWVNWESFGYLELADIDGGLQKYTVPEYQVKIGKAEQEKCIERM